MSSAENSNDCRDLYLELLKKSVSGTLFEREPDPDSSNFAADAVNHYMKGPAVTVLPVCRLENIRACVAEIVEKGIPGDLIETGVWRGGATIFMRGLLKAYGAGDRCVWVADSFEGLPESDAGRFPKETAFQQVAQRLFKNLAVTLEEVRGNFAAYGVLDTQVRFLKGWFKDTLPSAPIERLSLIRLDGDYYDSTMDALTNLYDKLAVGGMVIVDDYADDAWTNCRQAVDQFRVQRRILDPLIPVDSKCYWWRKTSLA
jgi:hypothetical protein